MPSEQPPTRVGTCTFCGGDGVVTRSFGINDSGPEIVPCPSCQPAPPSEQPREGTRVNPDDVERAERWIGDAISRYYDHGCDDEADRDVMAMRRCIDALKARLEPAQPPRSLPPKGKHAQTSKP